MDCPSRRSTRSASSSSSSLLSAMAFKAKSWFPAWYEPWINGGGSIMEYIFQYSSIFFNCTFGYFWLLLGVASPSTRVFSTRSLSDCAASEPSLTWRRDDFCHGKSAGNLNESSWHAGTSPSSKSVFMIRTTQPFSTQNLRLWSAGLLCHRLPRSHGAMIFITGDFLLKILYASLPTFQTLEMVGTRWSNHHDLSCNIDGLMIQCQKYPTVIKFGMFGQEAAPILSHNAFKMWVRTLRRTRPSRLEVLPEDQSDGRQRPPGWTHITAC